MHPNRDIKSYVVFTEIYGTRLMLIMIEGLVDFKLPLIENLENIILSRQYYTEL